MLLLLLLLLFALRMYVLNPTLFCLLFSLIPVFVCFVFYLFLFLLLLLL